MKFPPLLPILTLLALLGPVVAGLWGTVLPAFGHLPAAGLHGPSLDPFRAVFDWAGIGPAIQLSVTTGLFATLGSLIIVVLITAGWSGTRAFRLLEKLLSPLLSVPHAAAAFGFAFLIAPSGWIARLVSPTLTGWDRPVDWLIVQDPLGLTMTAGLIAKEVPFLLLITLAALSQVDATQRMRVAQSAGYQRITAWLKTVFPAIYHQIRLPVYVVLAYSMSVVDVAVILGPNTPPPLSVQIVKWMADPDLAFRLQAAAASLIQLGLVVGALILWRIGEILLGLAGRRWAYAGRRQMLDRPLRGIGFGLGAISAIVVFAGLAGLVIWSFAGFWAFPDALPQQLTLRSWIRHGPASLDTLATTAWIALVATGIGLALTLGCLQTEQRHNLTLTERGMWLLYLPLLIPQTAFLPGLQTLLINLGADMGIWPVIFTHLVFVLPYLRLSLQDPFKAWDNRNAIVAAALGSSPRRIFWHIRLPMMLAPILTAIAVGIAVSVGQYLATLLVGGGRVSTLTTEAVALASGGDRRAIGVYGLMQTAAALVPFALAIALPAIIYRNRKGLRNG
ncbi:ABC transporter permease [Aestuariibius sp. HNIBRBA575]|uniref:ABC transporter permease n=1 Tax=Aestuariibius sp. HNIBRBA575 TaxID=3233343 RepID=UPI0034A39B2F